MEGMPPLSFSGRSQTSASVVSIMVAMLAAFSRAVRAMNIM